MKTSIVYIRCPKHRSRPQKNLDVCRQCDRKKNCIAFKRQLQPELPFSSHPEPAASQTEPEEVVC